MKQLIYVPMEPYENRYTEQWVRWFEAEFKRYSLNYRIIRGKSLNPEVEPGSVFAPVSIVHYRATQLAKIHALVFNRKIRSGDVLFFDEFQFQGLEQIAYYLPQIGLSVDIFSFCNGGTWDPLDYFHRIGVASWVRHEEVALFTIFKKVFVPTEFHKQLIVQQLPQFESKVVVTGQPFNTSEILGNRKLIPFSKRKVDIVFPHRVDREKNPDLFLKVVQLVSRRLGRSLAVRISVTEKLTKNEYYDLLNNSKLVVSTASQETFGIATAEAVLLGSIPVLPNALSYREIYPPDYLFTPLSITDCADLVCKFLKLSDEEWEKRTSMLRSIIRRYDHSITRILQEMELIGN